MKRCVSGYKKGCIIISNAVAYTGYMKRRVSGYKMCISGYKMVCIIYIKAVACTRISTTGARHPKHQNMEYVQRILIDEPLPAAAPGAADAHSDKAEDAVQSSALRSPSSWEISPSRGPLLKGTRAKNGRTIVPVLTKTRVKNTCVKKMARG